MYNQGLRICNTQTIHLLINIMSTTYITGQMWLATAWEEEYQHRVMFANEEDAQAWASRWEDDLLDDVKVDTSRHHGRRRSPF
jgi:hypothetical protein